MWLVVGTIVGAVGVILAQQARRRLSRGEKGEVQEYEPREEDRNASDASSAAEGPVAAIEHTRLAEPLESLTESGAQRFAGKRACICGCYEMARGKYRFVNARHISRLSVDRIVREMLLCSNPTLDDTRMDYANRLQDNSLYHLCVCGCGYSPIGKSSRYCRGHDARHKMELLRLLERYG